MFCKSSYGKSRIIYVLFVTLLWATLAGAASIPIPNYSFEEPDFPDPHYIWLHDPSGQPDLVWTPGDPSQGDPWLGDSSWYGNTPSDGVHLAVCSWEAGPNCHVFQLLSNTFQADLVYTFSIDVIKNSSESGHWGIGIGNSSTSTYGASAAQLSALAYNSSTSAGSTVATSSWTTKSVSYIVTPDQIGQPIMIWFDTGAAGSTSGQTQFDNARLDTSVFVPETDPPTPDPMTWSVVPHATGPATISMRASTASDINGVEYYFTCTAGVGHDSGWQDSTLYVDIGLTSGNSYTYTVTTRDKSPNQNATSPSSAESATTSSDFILQNPGFEDDDSPSDNNPDYWYQSLFGDGTSLYHENDGQARTGSDCMEVESTAYGDYAYMYQDYYGVTPGQQYTLGAYLKNVTTADATTAFVHLEQECWNGSTPVSMPMPFITTEIPDDGNWHWVEFVQTAPLTGVDRIRTYLGSEYSGVGAFLIDDTYFGSKGPKDAHTPSPCHYGTRHITSDILSWQTQTSGTCNIYWNAGSETINDVNFDADKILLKANWDPNELDLSRDCGLSLEADKDYYWRLDCGDTGVVWKFSTKSNYMRGDIDENFKVSLVDFSLLSGNWQQHKDPYEVEWKKLEKMLMPQYGCAATVIDGKMHIFGGTRGRNNMSDAHQVYDPETDTWTVLSRMPYEYGGGRGWIGLANHSDGYIYALGGTQFSYGDGTKDALKYDPATDTWTRLPDLPVTKGVHAAISVGDYIYIIGGSTNRRTYRFDPATNTYLQLADIPSSWVMYIAAGHINKYDPVAEEYKDYIYIVAGDDSTNYDSDGYGRGAYKYDIDADSWSFINEDRVLGRTWLLTQHSTHNVADGHKLLIAGGHSTEGTTGGAHTRSPKVTYFDMNDPATGGPGEKFHEFGEDMFEGRCCGSAAWINSRLYIAGGYKTFLYIDGSPSDYATVVEEIWSYPYCIDPLTGDVDEDCYVNIADLVEIANNWLECNDPNQSLCE